MQRRDYLKSKKETYTSINEGVKYLQGVISLKKLENKYRKVIMGIQQSGHGSTVINKNHARAMFLYLFRFIETFLLQKKKNNNHSKKV